MQSMKSVSEKSKLNDNIFLIGSMGSGKTTVARCIAEQSSLTFYDSDAQIVKNTGVSIATIFDQEGEKGFRQREQETLDQLTQKSGIVIATGGGCVTIAKNREHLSKRGTVVYLRVSLTIQLARLALSDNKRPLFNGPNKQEKLQQLNASRSPLYESIANFIYSVDEKTPKQLAQQILSEAYHNA